MSTKKELERLVSSLNQKLEQIEQKVQEKRARELESLSTRVENLYRELDLEPEDDLKKLDVQSLSMLEKSLLKLKDRFNLESANRVSAKDEPVARLNDNLSGENSVDVHEVLVEMTATALGIPVVKDEEIVQETKKLHLAQGMKYVYG